MTIKWENASKTAQSMAHSKLSVSVRYNYNDG